MVIFDIVLLFTRMPVKETPDLPERKFEEDNLGISVSSWPLSTTHSMGSYTGKWMVWPWAYRFLLQ
jgi:hypothetical protein